MVQCAYYLLDIVLVVEVELGKEEGLDNQQVDGYLEQLQEHPRNRQRTTYYFTSLVNEDIKMYNKNIYKYLYLQSWTILVHQ